MFFSNENTSLYYNMICTKIYFPSFVITKVSGCFLKFFVQFISPLYRPYYFFGDQICFLCLNLIIDDTLDNFW